MTEGSPETSGVGSDGNNSDRAFRSPWLDQLSAELPANPLDSDRQTDVVIVGAGIAGIASAFFILRDTTNRVLLLERGRAGHGASGRNAGQLVTYFERPLCDLVDTFGFDMATQGQAEIESAWGLLDDILRVTGIAVPVDRFVGPMAMHTLNHLQVHLRNLRIRRRAGLLPEFIEISEHADFLADLSPDDRDLFTIVPQSAIRDRLGLSHDDYMAVLMNQKGCANSALVCQELLLWLQRVYAGRFDYADRTNVDRIVLNQSEAELFAGPHRVTAQKVLLCTNGFEHHSIDNLQGPAIGRTDGAGITPVVGYMAGFVGPPGVPAGATSYIVNKVIGGPDPYYYVTRRPYHHAEGPGTLTCLGGPELRLRAIHDYDPEGDLPSAILEQFDETVRPMTVPDRPVGLGYDYTWHGLMGYTPDKIRRVGFEPRNPVLLYNLGCNGVGFLPSIAGGLRIARLLSGQNLGPSLFDPR